MFGSRLRLPGSLLSDDPIDRQLLTADPYTNFHRANENANSSSTSDVQTKFCVRCKPQDWHVTDLRPRENTNAGDAGLARHRSQPRENINAGDTRPDVNQILEAVVPAPSVLAPIPEENDSMDTTIPEVAESGLEVRPRQPKSEPGSEPVDRNVRPRLAPDQ